MADIYCLSNSIEQATAARELRWLTQTCKVRLKAAQTAIEIYLFKNKIYLLKQTTRI